MKISILAMVLMSFLSLSALAHESQCEPLVLSGTKKTGEITVDFKRFESGRTLKDKTASDLLVGDELTSVVMPVEPNEKLTWPQSYEITGKHFKIIKTELMFKGEYDSGVKYHDLDATIEIPQEIADKYNGGANEAVIPCIETIYVCEGFDC